MKDNRNNLNNKMKEVNQNQEDLSIDDIDEQLIDKIKKIEPKISEDKIILIKQELKSSLKMTRLIHSGPLPLPQYLREYNDIVKGAAERILKMAENQAGHRQFIEKKIVKSGTRNETTSLYMAFIIVMFAIIGGIFLIYNGKDVIGLSSIITAIVGAATVFIVGKNVDSKEAENKKEKIKELKSN